MKVCTRCILDETIRSIGFDENGVCEFCRKHDLLVEFEAASRTNQSDDTLENLLEKIKADGKGKDYDCIVGLSGGTDSTYVLYKAKRLGLRPLAVHFDDSWNTEIAVSNIRCAVEKLGVDLVTHVVDWEEMRSLQRAFFLASVPDPGVPTDVGIFGALYQQAEKHKLKYILGGQSFVTEGTQPREWSYIDGTYVNCLHRLYGEVPLKTFPNFTIYSAAYYIFIKGVRNIPFLNYFPYSKRQAQVVLEREVGWRNYGEHHYESVYSRFINAFYDIKKFNIDRRKVTVAAEVRTGSTTREAALVKIATPPEITQETIEYCIGKLGFTHEEFEKIMAAPRKYFFPVSDEFSCVAEIWLHFETCRENAHGDARALL